MTGVRLVPELLLHVAKGVEQAAVVRSDDPAQQLLEAMLRVRDQNKNKNRIKKKILNGDQ